MNSLRNSVRIMGHAGDAPKMVMLESGRKIANFSIATNETFVDTTGTKKTETTWHKMVAYGPVAVNVEKYVRKGLELAVEGRLTNRVWEDKEGQKHFTTEIIVNQMLIVGQKHEENKTSRQAGS